MTDTDARPATAAGTLTGASGEALALTGMSIDADIHAGAITVDTTATFVNDLATPLEVTYLCPLPAGFAPIAATCAIAGRTIRADLVARADAVRAYDDALAAGQTAALAEQVGEDLFAFAVGNIAPDEVATIRVTVVGTADVDDGQATLRIPLSTGERYQPPGTSSRQPARRGPAERREPMATVTVRAHGVEPTVVTHDATYAATADETTATLTEIALLGDVVVRWPATAGWTAELSADGVDHAGAGDDGGGDDGGVAATGWLTVTATMPALVERAGRDVVVLLDRSGSMGGWQMEGARSVARAIVDRLGPADRACVLAFDTELETAPGAAGFASADAAQRRRIHEWIETVGARGGTELSRAFVTASGLVADSHGRATIVIVTDAEIGDEQRCIAAIGMTDANVITVGVGSRVNRGLIAAIAERSGGWSTIVESPERLDEAVGDIANRCAGESRRIDTVEVGGTERLDWSGAHPQLYPGHQTVLRAAVSGTPTTVTVSGPGYRETVAVAGSGSPHARHLWARARVATLLRGPAVDEQEALRVALAGGVLCRLTAFVAVDPLGRRLDTVPVRREVGHLDMRHSFAGAAAPLMAAPAMGGGIRAKTTAMRARFATAAAGSMDRAAAPAQSAMAPPPAVGARTVADLCAEIAAAPTDLTGPQRAEAIGAWAERVAWLLGGSDDAPAKALAAKLAAAMVGGDAAWKALRAWAADQAAAARPT